MYAYSDPEKEPLVQGKRGKKGATGGTLTCKSNRYTTSISRLHGYMYIQVCMPFYLATISLLYMYSTLCVERSVKDEHFDKIHTCTQRRVPLTQFLDIAVIRSSVVLL